MEKKKFRFSALLTLLLVAILSLALFACKDDENKPKPDGPEVGVYYFDANTDEYTLSLNSGNAFALIYKGESKSGSYKLENEALTLDFAKDEDGTLSATLSDGALVLSYDGATMRFLKKINYTVSFDSKSGSGVKDQTVVNGKTAIKPADPTRDGYIFVGWYGDEAYTAPYNFGTSVSANTTLYAQWTEETNNEYEIDFDLGYNASMQAKQTVGGKLFDIATPTRDGYEFKGWWISMYEDGGKLSYEYTANTVFTANTTLFALWESTSSSTLPAPNVSVEAGAVKWDAVAGAGAYYVTIIGPDGETVLEKNTLSTIENVAFSSYDAGDYEITVVANPGSANSSTAVRYYKNKALNRVSQFSVIEPSVLIYDEVPGAEKYLITVICGNENHNHTEFDNGTSRSFNFANCEMKKGGIEFIVTAVANGYASSVSEVYKYERKLATVNGYAFDNATQTLSWNAVASASEYMVSISCGNKNHNHGYFNNGSKTSISLKECSGNIVVNVYPVAKGYNSPSTTSFSTSKTLLATPANVKVNDTLVSWDAVEGASSYEVMVNGQVYAVNENKVDLATKVDLIEEVSYSIAVKAKGATESVYSDAIVASYNAMGAVNYAGSIVSWAPVLGADKYEVQINDGEVATVDAGLNSSFVELNQAGYNEVKVRFVNGSTRSDWAKTTVYAHRVVFDSLGGDVVDVQYKAVGDVINAPKPTKYGYEFEDWYTTPQGPLSNGLAYTDEKFNESSELVLFAFYAPKSVNVTYNYGLGGEGDEVGAIVKYDNEFTLAVPECTDGTGAFAGWFSAPYGNGVQYTDEKGNSLANWDSLEDTELYAFYINQVLSYTLTKVNGKDAYSVSAGARFTYLSEITIPATYNGLPVAMVAGSAFANKTNLVTINIPNTVEYISTVDPFEGCSNLEAINVYEVEGNTSVRYWSENGVLFDYGTFSTSAGATAKLAYMPLAKTGTYRIPYGVAEIPSNAFANSKISKVVIPATVNTIGVEAFANCTNLTSVVFEADASNVPLTIEARAFSGCTSLEKILLPQRLQSIGTAKSIIKNSATYALASVDTTFVANAFIGCTALAEVNVSVNNALYKSIDGVLFNKNATELLYVPAQFEGEYTVPSGVRTIAEGAFLGCKQVTDVVIPNTVTTVGNCAFFDSGVTSVTFKGNGFNDVTIGVYAFRECSNLTEVNFEVGNRVKTIKEGAFADSGIEAIEIPAFVTNIEKQAFYGCSSLEEVSFAPNGANLAFGADVFYECTSLETITLPATLTEMPGIFSGCSSLQAVNVADGNTHFKSIEGVLFDFEETEILFYPQGKSGVEGVYTLPATVKKIGNGVFRGNQLLEKVIIPNTIEYIGIDAFRDTTALEMIEFAGTDFAEALEIAEGAFRGSSIENITLPTHTKTLGASAFQGTNPTTIGLNEGLETIGDYAFEGAYLYYVEIKIPSTVQYIGHFAFSNASLYESFSITDTVDTPSQLVEIGEGSFRRNKYLKAFTVPASLQKIGAYAFYENTAMTAINFAQDGDLQVIGAHAFESSYINNVVIPASVTSIEAYAFYNIKTGYNYSTWSTNPVVFSFAEGGTEDLVIGAPSTALYTYWGEPVSKVEYGYAFASNEYATLPSLPDRTTIIEDYSFYYFGGYGGNGLTLNFGENARLERIGESAFYYAGLNSIIIPKTVKNSAPTEDGRNLLGIGARAFYGTYDTLETVTFQMGGTDALTIGESAFENVDLLETITLPARLAPYTTASGDEIAPLANGARVFLDSFNIENVFVEDAQNSYYVDIDGVLYTADLTELVFCPNAKTGTVTVPGTVTKVHDYAFAATYYSSSPSYDESAQVEAIVFEGGTEDLTIGTRAFAYCSKITSIVIPANAVSVGAEAFYNCVSLASLTLPSALSQFDMSLVYGCPLTDINITDGEFFTTQDGVLFNADKTRLIAYPVKATATTYTVPATVKAIEEKAFYNNKTISEIVLPEGLIEINANAFTGCTSLTKINVPSTVEIIGADAFNGCTALNDLTIAKGDSLLVIENKVFYNTTSLKTLELPARVCALGEQAFYNSGIQTLEFANGIGISEIGYMTFYKTGLTSIEIPASVRTIADNAFYNCASLKTVTMEEGLVEMGAQVFANCTALESVQFPATLKTMGINTFYDDDYGDPIACSNLKSVTFGENSQLEVIPTGTFAYSGLESIVIPASVLVIEDQLDDEEEPGAFAYCANLKEVVFESGSQCGYIGSYAFYESGIESIEVPSLVASIGEYAFAENSSLESVAIPATVTQLGGYMFENCTALSDVELDTKVSELPYRMFANCTSLKSISIPASITAIKNSFDGSGLEAYEVAKGNTAFASIDGVLFTADCTQIISYPAGKLSETFEVPNTVTTIADNTFYGIEALTSVTFEEGGDEDLTIGEYAFAEMTNLKSIVLPERLVSIGEYCFRYDEALEEVTLPSTLTMIPYYAFYYCSSLKTINFAEGLEYIDEYAFYGCESITELNLPDSLEEVADYAFYYCDSVYKITLPASLVELNDYMFGYSGCPAIEVYNRSSIEFTLDNAEDYRFDYVLNIYTPEEGASIFFEEGDWRYLKVTETPDEGEPVVKNYLYKYLGSETEITLPVADGMYSQFLAGSSVTEVTVPAGYAEIPAESFANAPVETVVLPDTVTSIGDYAFYQCENLTTINLGKVTSIGENAFYYCTSLNTIDISSLETIGDYAFYRAGLTSLELPATLTTIGESAFSYSALPEVVIPMTVTTIGYNAFYYCNGGSITIFVKGSEKPEGWHSSWYGSSSYATVLWAYSGEDVIYSFVTGFEGEGYAVESITDAGMITLPNAPEIEGYIFNGWYNDSEFTNKVSSPYYNSEKNVLYAQYLDEQQVKEQKIKDTMKVSSLDDITTVTLGTPFEVTFVTSNDYIPFKFTATVSGSYQIKIENDDSELDYAHLFDADMNKLSGNWGFYETKSFDLEAGQEYYLRFDGYYWNAGSITITIVAPTA